MRIMTSDEVAKYPIENPKYDRTQPFYPPDPDLIGKFFAVWIPTEWFSTPCAHDARAITHKIVNDFNGTIINSYERDVPNHRKFCHIAMLPTDCLTIPTDDPFNLQLKMRPPETTIYNAGWHDRQCIDTFLLTTRLMKYEESTKHQSQVAALLAVRTEYQATQSESTKRTELINEYTTIRDHLYKTCAEYLFDQGSYFKITDTKKPEYTLITPFKFPPGYVWDTARALTATFGDNSPFIKRFIQLAITSGTGTRKPDQWWETCDDPRSVFMILFSRMLGPERWQYTLACLESTLGHSVDWNATL